MKKTIWALFDNRMGSVGQAKGILQELNPDLFDIKIINIEYNKLAKLPNIVRGKSLLGISSKSAKTLKEENFPDLVVSISRRTAPVARWIKKHSPKTKLVQLMHIGSVGAKDFELIIVSEHDMHKKPLPNIFYITGCPHRITPEVIDRNKIFWSEKFAHLEKPLTAVIVGGAIKAASFSNENAQALGNTVRNIKNKIGGSILITTSRRTGTEAQDIIMYELQGLPMHTYLWGDKSENPYLGYLSCADNIIVTGDTVSMCSEACGTGAPVMLFTGNNWLTKKHLRFVESLVKNKYATLVEDPKATDFKPEKILQTSKMVANKITDIFF